MDKPIYKINGKERKKLKKDISELKSFAKNFWYFHQLDKDMVSFYGGKDGYPMSDDNAQKKLDKIIEKIKIIEEQLLVLYDV